MSHVSYANPIRTTHKSAVGAFGATTATESYIGPKGRRGIVRDIEVHLTADAVGTTTVPEVDVGNASGDTSYARFRLGTAAGAGYTAVSMPKRARSLVAGNPTPPVLNDFPGHVALETAFIPADTPFVITNKQGSGGAPAGTGYSVVTIDWF
jgi:hypothetical protein